MSSNGTSLRRSCQGCIKVKRRCDLLFPECSRCLKKGAHCQYINIPLSSRPNPASDNGGKITKPAASSRQQQQQQQQRHHNRQYNIPQAGTVVTTVATKVAKENEVEITTSNQIRQLIMSSDESSEDGSSSDDSFNSNSDKENGNNRVEWIRPAMHMEIRKHQSPYIIKFITRIIGQAPGLFIEGKSSFIHPCVYDKSFPQPIENMRALCALYKYQNTDNQLLPSRSIKVSALVLQQMVLLHRFARRATSFEDLAASVQALTLALCIQLSEGNIHNDIVQKSLTLLAALNRKLWYSVPHELPSSMSPWYAWIFAETVRRTIVFSHIVMAAFSLTTRGYACRTPFVDALPFDGRTFLWDARSEEEWNKMSTRPDFSMVSVIEFTDLLQSGRALCFSSFEGLIIATCRGLELPIHDPLKILEM